MITVDYIDPVRKDIADFLLMTMKVRAINIDTEREHTCHDIMVDMLMRYPAMHIPVVKEVFETLSAAKAIPFRPCGHDGEGERLYRVRQELVMQLPENFP